MSLRVEGFEGVVASLGDDLGVSIRLDVLEKKTKQTLVM